MLQGFPPRQIAGFYFEVMTIGNGNLFASGIKLGRVPKTYLVTINADTLWRTS
jgi:hypothetical protein